LRKKTTGGAMHMWWLLALLLACAYAAGNFFAAWTISGGKTKGEPLSDRVVDALYWGNAGVAGVLFLAAGWMAYSWKKSASGATLAGSGAKAPEPSSPPDTVSDIAKL
jgi:hypothetical protein